MKLKFKHMKNKVFVVRKDISEEVSAYNRTLNQVKDALVDRSVEVEAIKLALICGEHVMLEGLHGTGKTQLANALFRRITGATCFRKQLMKNTQSDELLGPMDSRAYRERAVWTHNITGMLPSAHFAFLDEVYRASDMLLPAILGIMNERIFMNGIVPVQCPLISAIGTTNFVTVNKELDAFHDRWLVKLKVSPLKACNHRIEMLRKWLSPDDGAVISVPLSVIAELRKAVVKVPADEEVMELYEDLVSKYRTKSNLYVSDRRFAQAFRLAQATALLNFDPEDGEFPEVVADSLYSTVYGLAVMGTEQQQHFANAAEEALGDYVKFKQETDDFNKMLERVQETAESANKATSKEEREKLYAKAKKILTGVNSLSVEDRPVKESNQQKLTQIVELLEGVLKKLEPKV